jgi:hypothetical protein
VQGLSGRTPIVYSYPSFWSTQMAGSTAFSHYPLWLASYRPTAPAPLAGWDAWSLWQYTSTATVPGIPGTGAVDLSRFNGTEAQLARLANEGPGTAAGPSIRPLVRAVLSPTKAPTHAIRLTGQTSRQFAGEHIYRQGLYAHAWHTLATTKVNRNGTYGYVISPSGPTGQLDRVLLPATSRHLAGGSHALKVRIR